MMRQYSEEFKTVAVNKYQESGKKLSKIAREMGISPSTLYGWINKDNKTLDSNYSGCIDDNTCSLKKEILNLKDENEILMKTIIYLARNSK